MSSMAAAPAKKPSFWRTVKAVAWSFVGLRARGDYEEDVKNLNPLHIIVVGLIAVTLLDLSRAPIERTPNLTASIGIFLVTLGIVYGWKSKLSTLAALALGAAAGMVALQGI